MVQVKDTDYEYFAQDDFRLRKPDIKIVFDATPTSQQEVGVTVRLTNPLPITLHKGIFQIEGPGLNKPVVLKVKEIAAGETGAATFRYTPPWAGRGSLVAKFYAKELNDVDGFLAYEVRPRPEDVIMSNEVRPSDGWRREVLLESNRGAENPIVADNETRFNGNNNTSRRYIARTDIAL